MHSAGFDVIHRLSQMGIYGQFCFQFIDIVNLILKIFVTEKYGIFLAIYGNRYRILSGES